MEEQLKESDALRRSSRCEQCDTLMDALREFEAGCREFEGVERFDVTESVYVFRLRTLEHRRDCALEVLLKHQRLDHLED